MLKLGTIIPQTTDVTLIDKNFLKGSKTRIEFINSALIQIDFFFLFEVVVFFLSIILFF